MKKTISIISILFLCQFNTFSQYTKEDKIANDNSLSDLAFKDRIFTGGNVGFGIYNNLLYLDLAPIVGYKITNNLGAGVGLRYSLLRHTQFKTNQTNYGGSLFARYKLIPQVFLHAELEALRSYNYNSTTYLERAMAYMGFVGAGYSFGEGVSFNVLVLYDLIDHPNSPYQNTYLLGRTGPPVILRGGISVNF